jgi:hypothetical protein
VKSANSAKLTANFIASTFTPLPANVGKWSKLMADNTNSSPLHRPEASVYLLKRHGVKAVPGTLAKLACTGGGPEFSYRGRFPVYTPEALDDWAKAKSTKAVRNTGEGKALRAQLVQQAAA